MKNIQKSVSSLFYSSSMTLLACFVAPIAGLSLSKIVCATLVTLPVSWKDVLALSLIFSCSTFTAFSQALSSVNCTALSTFPVGALRVFGHPGTREI